jgi:zinc protease
MVTALQAELSEPGALAARGFAKQLYGPEHPAGRIRSASSVKSITPTHIKQFHASRFSPQGATLVMVGDFENSSLERWQALFESWTNTNYAQLLNLPPLVRRSETLIQLIDKPDLTQATLLIGHPVAGELSDERNALALANYILGGGNFSSRLMAQIRSKLGKTYGISSQTSFGRQQGTFAISTATQSVQLAEMLQTIFAVYRQFSSQGVTAEELAKAQQYTIGSISFQLEGIGAVAEKLLWLAMYNRPRSYLEEFASMINDITLQHINEVIERNFGCEHPAFVVVGNKSQTISQLSGFGRVESVSFRKGQ